MSRNNSRIIRDPDSVLDFTTEWAEWLTGGETITDHTVTVPDGINLDSSSRTDTAVTAWISGGTDGATHGVTFRVTTSAGRTDERTMVLATRQR